MAKGYKERSNENYSINCNGEKRKITTISFTWEEWEILEAKAKAYGISRGEYIRNAVAAFKAEATNPQVIINYLEVELARMKNLQGQL